MGLAVACQISAGTAAHPVIEEPFLSRRRTLRSAPPRRNGFRRESLRRRSQSIGGHSTAFQDRCRLTHARAAWQQLDDDIREVEYADQPFFRVRLVSRRIRLTYEPVSSTSRRSRHRPLNPSRVVMRCSTSPDPNARATASRTRSDTVRWASRWAPSNPESDIERQLLRRAVVVRSRPTPADGASADRGSGQSRGPWLSTRTHVRWRRRPGTRRRRGCRGHWPGYRGR